LKAEIITPLPPPEEVFEWPRQAVRERNWTEASSRWSVLRSAYPKNPVPWIQGAVAHIEAGELEQAEVLLAHARQHFPKQPHSLTESAALAIKQQEWDKAEAFLQQAREMHPDNLQTWMKSAICAEQRGDLEQAEAYYRKACECAPGRQEPYLQHAELYMRAKQWERALNEWEIVRNRFPSIRAGYLRAAEAARELGRTQEARQLLLAHQYGADFIDTSPREKQLSTQRSKHSNFSRLLELIWTKAIFNLRSEVHRNYLSYGWWILEPLLHMIVYYVVFGMLLKRGGDNFPVFLLTGLIPWMWFMKSVGGSSNSIITGHNLMMQVGLPTIVFPAVSLVQATLKQIPIFILLFGFLLLQGYMPGAHWWALLLVILVQALLIIVFSFTVAAVIPFIRDLAYLVPTGLMFLMFLSGVFYDYRMISAEWQELFLLNPVAFLLKCYREILIDGIPPDLVTLAWWGLGCTSACILLFFVYGHLRYIYPRIVME
jgi:lipopolysaccharide transport system permease protein